MKEVLKEAAAALLNSGEKNKSPKAGGSLRKQVSTTTTFLHKTYKLLISQFSLPAVPPPLHRHELHLRQRRGSQPASERRPRACHERQRRRRSPGGECQTKRFRRFCLPNCFVPRRSVCVALKGMEGETLCTQEEEEGPFFPHLLPPFSPGSPGH